MPANPPRILVVVGSTREGRFSSSVAAWLMDRLVARDDLAPELIDLRDHPLPFFDQVVPPAFGHRDYSPEVARWAQRVEAADGYLIVTSEYNHGYPAVLKNALDHVFPEFNRKPVAFAGYGNAGGARAIEQLRMVAVELELAPLRHAVHIPGSVMLPVMQAEGPLDVELFSVLDDKLDQAATDLVWWARALTQARVAA